MIQVNSIPQKYHLSGGIWEMQRVSWLPSDWYQRDSGLGELRYPTLPYSLTPLRFVRTLRKGARHPIFSSKTAQSPSWVSTVVFSESQFCFGGLRYAWTRTVAGSRSGVGVFEPTYWLSTTKTSSSSVAIGSLVAPRWPSLRVPPHI
jgi:hypothetical protein